MFILKLTIELVLLLLFQYSVCNLVEQLFIDWRFSLINDGKVINTNEHYSVSLDCAATYAGQRLLSSKVFAGINITWLIDNYSPVYSGADGRKIIYDVGNYRKSLLKINDISHGDAGLYTCNLDKGRKNEHRFRTIAYFVLLTNNPPVFHVYLNDKFNISCPIDILYYTLQFAEADLTKWSIKWLLNNNSLREGQLVNNSNLQFTVINSIEIIHEGIWQCQMERIGRFDRGKTKRIYLLKRFKIKVYKLPSYLLRTPTFEILRIMTPFLGFVFVLFLCSHLVLAVVLFERFANIETKFQVWQIVNKFSKKNYMKFYLHQLEEERKLMEKAVISDELDDFLDFN